MSLQAETYPAQLESFSKEQVKRRLRTQAASLWGLQETDTDYLDPVIDLLIGACAVEFERTAHQVYASQARILERLAELMVPEVTTNAHPAHAIMHASPDAPLTRLKRTDLFSVDKELLDGSKAVIVPVILSPVADTRLFDATVACQATKDRLTFYSSPLKKGDSYSAANGQLSSYSTLWLGIKLNKHIKSLEGMSFYFDWKDQQDNTRFLPLLASTRWKTGDATSIHLRHSFTSFSDEESRAEEALAMKSYEDQVLYFYNRHFVTIETKQLPLRLSRYPAVFTSMYDEATLSQLKEELLWVEISFPEGVSQQTLDGLNCSLNCFPVMNRKLYTGNRPYALSSNLNIIPLISDEHFMAVVKVFSASRQYHAATLDKLRNLEDGSYTIKQHGVNRFDQRDAQSLLHYLYELMRDESAAFKASGNYALNSEIRNLEQGLSRLKLHYITKTTAQPARCHLFLQTKQPEDVWVEFWTSQGEVANSIPAGTRAKPLTQSSTKRTGLLLATTTSGGREPLTEAEKVHAYRFALLTRSRIATEEDLRAASFAMLGDRITHVEVKKGFKKDHTAKSGFSRTIDIVLTPSKDYKLMDWGASCKELEAYIEQHKLFLTNIQVYTKP